ncbi:LysR family transcriptional regulator [Burkholderia oklahomensis]|uniref:Bacterial regulatory helix-turn-helix, lysR family protein n=1 Tax=Burkholderia oklahomensis TaxID=342113 RepID=A0AAI8B463_9BURK|nr:LysR family transcriptional regulator [Burkholderia oklahomensis]AIO65748.1 bacterial regulatory helix-turn-helix, lysR family protein [Burkholderia oklahomensis]AOI42903.1 LysR family transcriptional regulator [Burkholderia oklahomensis EO147]KUY58556.1 LysR family transcriptional regulator [Burkholderia oklahomensis EO147]QPS37648.1 LysR family transcriptional regulator [Burkholderia oklahomensis]
MDRIDLFRVFARVVECANFTRAADTLGMPRSSVSAAIQELEGRVGARLLNRTTRKVTPTQDGTALYERCLRLIADVEETENLFRHSTVGPSGTLRVDMPGRIGRLIVAPALPGFLDQYPQISIDLGVTDRTVNLIEERVDCALRVGTLSDSGLIARAIGDLPLINVASPAYLARHGVPRTPADLARHRPINYASPSSGRVAPWEWVEGDTVERLALQGRVTVNSAEAYIACCLSGLGLIQIPAYDVDTHLRAGELVEVLPDHRAAPMPMTLLYPHRQHLSRRFHVFADWLETLLKATVLVGCGGRA